MRKRYTSREELPLLLTIEEVACLLRVSRAFAYNLAHQTDFPLTQLGTRLMVERDRLFIWLDKQNPNQ